MSTNREWASLEAGAIVSLSQLGTNLISPVRAEHEQLAADLWGAGGVLGGSKVSLTYGSSPSAQVTLAGNFAAYTGDGDRVAGLTSETWWQGVPFANSGATTYYIGAAACDVPQDVRQGSDGGYYYTHHIERVGVVWNPDSVSVVGGTSLELDMATAVEDGWGSGRTRVVVVWLTTPASGSSSVAIHVGTVVESSGTFKISIPNLMGQESLGGASTTAGDYNVALLGPRITSTDISANTAYFFMGTITSTVFTNTAQFTIDSMATMEANLEGHAAESGAHSPSSMLDAYNTSGAGDVVKLSAFDGSQAPGAADVIFDASVSGIGLIATDGQAAALVDGQILSSLLLDGSAHAGNTYDHGAAIHDLICIGDGSVFIVGAAGSGSNCARRLTLNSLSSPSWSFAHGATLYCVEDDADQIYVGGAAGTSSYTIHALNRSTGAALWDLATGTTVYGIASNGSRLLLAGTFDSSFNIYELDRASGTALTGENFDSAALNDIVMSGELFWVCGDGAGSGKTISGWHANQAGGTIGEKLWESSITGVSAIDRLAFDGRYLYSLHTTGGAAYVTVWEPLTGARVQGPMAIPSTTAGYAIDADGSRIYVGGTGKIGSYHWPQGGLFRRTTGGQRYDRPFRKLLIPIM